MLKYITERILLALLAIFIILFLSYLLLGSFGANPFAASASSAQQANEQFIAAGLNRPVLERFGQWFSGIFVGNFGVGYGAQFSGRSIPQIYFGPLIFTVALALPAFILSAGIGIALGVFSGYKRGTYIDVIINFFVRFFIALPAFVLAPFFIIFGNAVGLPTRFALSIEGASAGQVVLSAILPILVLTLGSIAAYTNYTRNQITNVLTSNYVLIAKSKGLGTTEIFFKYVFKNISLPLIQLILPSFVGLLAGSLIIQSFFAVPGTAVLLIEAFPNGEINIIMFNTLFFVTLGIFIQILADVILVLFDPRIKIASKNPYGIMSRMKASKIRNKEFVKKE